MAEIACIISSNFMFASKTQSSHGLLSSWASWLSKGIAFIKKTAAVGNALASARKVKHRYCLSDSIAELNQRVGLYSTGRDVSMSFASPSFLQS